MWNSINILSIFCMYSERLWRMYIDCGITPIISHCLDNCPAYNEFGYNEHLSSVFDCSKRDTVYLPVLSGTQCSGGSKGGRKGRAPPLDPKFLHFHAVFGKSWPNNRLASPPLRLAPPPLGNPGSATAVYLLVLNGIQCICLFLSGIQCICLF